MCGIRCSSGTRHLQRLLITSKSHLYFFFNLLSSWFGIHIKNTFSIVFLVWRSKIVHLPKIPYRYIVGLAGPPGSGKSTLSSEVARRVNKLWLHKASSLDSQVKPPDVAIVLPMDGFHLYRSQLDKMEVSLFF
jgi:hypothetical protein